MVVQMVKGLFLLPLRYAFLIGLMWYHWFQGIWNSLVAPFEPIIVELRKFPDADISVSGIIRTLTRAYFLVLLLGYHYAKMTADIFLVPISNGLGVLRKILNIPDTVPKVPKVEPRD